MVRVIIEMETAPMVAIIGVAAESKIKTTGYGRILEGLFLSERMNLDKTRRSIVPIKNPKTAGNHIEYLIATYGRKTIGSSDKHKNSTIKALIPWNER